jgi:hypothetical protein
VDFVSPAELGFFKVMEKILLWCEENYFPVPTLDFVNFDNIVLPEQFDKDLQKRFSESSAFLDFLNFEMKLHTRVLENMEKAFEKDPEKFIRKCRKKKYKFFLGFEKLAEPLGENFVTFPRDSSYSIRNPYVSDGFSEEKALVPRLMVEQTAEAFLPPLEDEYAVALHKLCKIFVQSRTKLQYLEDGMAESPTPLQPELEPSNPETLQEEGEKKEEGENLFNLITNFMKGENDFPPPTSQEESQNLISYVFPRNPIVTLHQHLQVGGSRPLSGLSQGAGPSGLRRIVPSPVAKSRPLGIVSPPHFALPSPSRLSGGAGPSIPLGAFNSSASQRAIAPGKTSLEKKTPRSASQEKGTSLKRKSSSFDEGA